MLKLIVAPPPESVDPESVDAHFAGSCPGLVGGCAGAAVAVMPDHSGNGY